MKKLLAILLLCLLIGGCADPAANTEPEIIPAENPKTVAMDTTPAVSPPDTNIKPVVSTPTVDTTPDIPAPQKAPADNYMGLKPGTDINKVYEVLGQPDDTWDFYYPILYYGDVEIYLPSRDDLQTDVIYSILVPELSGIKVGDPLQKLQNFFSPTSRYDTGYKESFWLGYPGNVNILIYNDFVKYIFIGEPVMP